MMDTPEIKTLRIGYVPLTDCLPLIIAKGLGLFAEYALDVTLEQEASWANIRDKLIVGHLDAAHMLAPMVLASTLGLGGLTKPLTSAFTLNLNGNAITLSQRLCDAIGYDALSQQPPLALASFIRERARANKPPLVFAIVFPYASHNYLLRDWMASADIDPDRDVKLVVLPPPQMVDNMRLAHIDGFCVGEPWNTVAIQQGIGQSVVLGCEYWPRRMEKVLAITQDWADQYPLTHAALLRALYKACAWLDTHRADAAELVHGHSLLPLDRDIIAPGLTGQFCCAKGGNITALPDLVVFHRHQANRPVPAQGEAILTQMQRWRQLEQADVHHQNINRQIAQTCFREDIYSTVLGPQ